MPYVRYEADKAVLGGSAYIESVTLTLIEQK